ncbi:MAG: hypothetical protein IPL99_08870 [Candidatus Competibacteraceae bacterium]|nr:hypothetical protein [Candidatus Competibacteraceae bacterium]
MPEDTPLKADEIQNLGQSLAGLPDPSATLTKRKVVALLASDIQSARDKGYTLKAIVRHLRSRGFDINYNTLRDALPRQKKSRSGKKKPRGVGAEEARTNGDGVRTRAVAPSNTPGTRDGSPAKSPRSVPDAPGSGVVPSGASSVLISGGRFVPAPDSDVL